MQIAGEQGCQVLTGEIERKGIDGPPYLPPNRTLGSGRTAICQTTATAMWNTQFLECGEDDSDSILNPPMRTQTPLLRQISEEK